jgi:hypothetical protein
MSEELNRDDLTALLAGASAEEVDQIHRLLREWNSGPGNSFPVQLALLTRAQWRIAATLPRTLTDSRKLIEQHLAEYRRQTQSLVTEFTSAVDKKNGDLEKIVLQHAETVKRDTAFASSRLTDVNEVAKGIQKNLQMAVIECNYAKDALAQERQRFERASQRLNDAVNLRGIHWYIIGTLAACLIALLIGHYAWHQ